MKYLFALFLSMTAAFAQEGVRAPCIPSETFDCKGTWVTSQDQCKLYSDIMCRQFEEKNQICYGLNNKDGCVDGTMAHHFRRPIERR